MTTTPRHRIFSLAFRLQRGSRRSIVIDIIATLQLQANQWVQAAPDIATVLPGKTECQK
jgi:Tfp pilus assembly protein PilN